MKANLLNYCLTSANPDAELRKNYPHIKWDKDAKNILAHLKNHKQLVSDYNRYNARRTTIYNVLFGAGAFLMLAIPITGIVGYAFLLPLCTTAIAVNLCILGIPLTIIALPIVMGIMLGRGEDIVNFARKGMSNPSYELHNTIPMAMLDEKEFRLYKDYIALCRSENININSTYHALNQNYSDFQTYESLVNKLDAEITTRTGNSDMLLENAEDISNLQFLCMTDLSLNPPMILDCAKLIVDFIPNVVENDVDTKFPNLTKDCKHYLTTMLKCANMSPTS